MPPNSDEMQALFREALLQIAKAQGSSLPCERLPLRALWALMHGQLSDDEQEKVAQHLRECDQCYRAMIAMAAGKYDYAEAILESGVVVAEPEQPKQPEDEQPQPVVDRVLPLSTANSVISSGREQAALMAAGGEDAGVQTIGEVTLFAEEKEMRRQLGYPTMSVRIVPEEKRVCEVVVRTTLGPGMDRTLTFITPDGTKIEGAQSEDGDEWHFDLSQLASPVLVGHLAQCKIHWEQAGRR